MVDQISVYPQKPLGVVIILILPGAFYSRLEELAGNTSSDLLMAIMASGVAKLSQEVTFLQEKVHDEYPCLQHPYTSLCLWSFRKRVLSTCFFFFCILFFQQDLPSEPLKVL